MAMSAMNPPQINMDFVVVQPEPIATVLTVLCPAGVMLLTPAAKPTMQTTAPTLTVPAGSAVRTERATALTTVVVTMLEEKFVSRIAQVIKKTTIPITGRLAVSGDRVTVSQSLIPMSALVRHDPSQVAAPVIKMLPQRIPLVVASLKFNSRSPSTLVMKRIMQPRSGGIAVDQLLIVA